MSEAAFEDFARLDVRVGRVLRAFPNEKAREPALCLVVDFGPGLGEKQSSAKIAEAHAAGELAGRLVLAVVNFAPRRVAGWRSDVLVLGVYSDGGAGPVILVGPDADARVKPGDRLG